MVVENAFYRGPRLTNVLVAIVNASGAPGTGSLQVMNNLHVIRQASAIDRIIETTSNDARYYVGHMSWRADELQREIAQGRWLVVDAELEPIFRKNTDGLWEELFEKALGPEHPDVAQVLNNLASLYQKQARYSEAELRYQRALAIREKALGPEHPAVAQTLNNLASLYQAQGRYAEAEPLYVRSLVILDRALGATPAQIATVLANLAELYKVQGRHSEAESLLARSRELDEKARAPK